MADTKLNLDPELKTGLRVEAAEQGRTMSDIANDALRLYFAKLDEELDGE